VTKVMLAPKRLTHSTMDRPPCVRTLAPSAAGPNEVQLAAEVPREHLGARWVGGNVAVLLVEPAASGRP
jgi:hypothetical protein